MFDTLYFFWYNFKFLLFIDIGSSSLKDTEACLPLVGCILYLPGFPFTDKSASNPRSKAAEEGGS